MSAAADKIGRLYLDTPRARSYGRAQKPGCCIRCGKGLDPARQVMLELDQRIDEYHDFGGVPENSSQGWFEFGPDCAAVLRARARLALGVKP